MIYVGRKCSRGCVGDRDPVIPNVINLNVTSGSMNKINGLPVKALSPMYLGPVDELDMFGTGDMYAKVFENYWQYGKIFMELGHLTSRKSSSGSSDFEDIEDMELTDEWYSFRDYGYGKTKGDRHPRGTKSNEVMFVDKQGKNHYRYYTACDSYYLGQRLSYIESRKLIYAPVYACLVKQTAIYQALMEKVAQGQSYQVLDLDVRTSKSPVTVELLRKEINNPKAPFGHGYVMAGLLAGIDPEEYNE